MESGTRLPFGWAGKDTASISVRSGSEGVLLWSSTYVVLHTRISLSPDPWSLGRGYHLDEQAKIQSVSGLGLRGFTVIVHLCTTYPPLSLYHLTHGVWDAVTIWMSRQRYRQHQCQIRLIKSTKAPWSATALLPEKPLEHFQWRTKLICLLRALSLSARCVGF